MKKIAVVMVCLFCMAASPQVQVEKIKGVSHPSGACLVSGNLYVTDLGKKTDALAKDGYGAIAVYNEKWELQNKNLLLAGANAKINSPGAICQFNYKNKSGGFSMLRKAIAIADVDKVYGYELIYNSRVFYIDMSKETRNLGGITCLNDSTFVVSATDKNCLFKININTRAYEKWPVPIKSPKGICTDATRKNIYCVGWGENNKGNGEIFKIDAQTMRIEKIGDDLGYLTGCAVYNNNLYYADWNDSTLQKKGMIHYIDLNTHALHDLFLSERIGGPGYIYIDEAQKLLLVPALSEGVVYKVELQ